MTATALPQHQSRNNFRERTGRPASSKQGNNVSHHSGGAQRPTTVPRGLPWARIRVAARDLACIVGFVLFVSVGQPTPPSAVENPGTVPAHTTAAR